MGMLNPHVDVKSSRDDVAKAREEGSPILIFSSWHGSIATVGPG